MSFGVSSGACSSGGGCSSSGGCATSSSVVDVAETGRGAISSEPLSPEEEQAQKEHNEKLDRELQERKVKRKAKRTALRTTAKTKARGLLAKTTLAKAKVLRRGSPSQVAVDPTTTV